LKTIQLIHFFRFLDINNIRFILLISCVLNSCSKFNEETNTLDGEPCLALGHGGMGISSNYPINSTASILTCLEKGSAGTEIDIQLTKDHVLVLFHDETMDNTTGFTGSIHDYNWNEIKHLYYSNSLQQTFPLISLQNLIDTVDNLHDYHFVLDCKLYPKNIAYTEYIEHFSHALNNIIELNELEDNIFIETHHIDLITSLQNMEVEVPLMIIPTDFETGFELASQYQLFGISLAYDQISAEEVQKAHEAEFAIAIWNTYSNVENIIAINKHPDMIETDKIEHLLSLNPE
jgi:glycerophosphoryl diester phosphodiesterase